MPYLRFVVSLDEVILYHGYTLLISPPVSSSSHFLSVCLWTLPPPSAVNTDEERHVPQRCAAVDRLGKQEWRQIHFLIPKVSKSKLWVPAVGVWLRIRGWSRWFLLQNFPGFNSRAWTLFLLVHSGLNTKLSQKSLAADYYSTSHVGGVTRGCGHLDVNESKMVSEFLIDSVTKRSLDLPHELVVGDADKASYHHRLGSAWTVCRYGHWH